MSAVPRIWKFGDDINTDLIIPGKYLDNYDPRHLASHAMEGASKEFCGSVRPGDIIVAGRNFGCGSSREQAVIALKHAGVRAVVAKSFARIFYRNAINLGLVVAISDDACEIASEGDLASLDLDEGSLSVRPSGRVAKLRSPPSHVKAILAAGGLVPYVKMRLEGKPQA